MATRARTRHGLPEPRTILSGGVIRIAPFGGSWSRFIRLARPNLLLPCMMLWHGNGGSNVNAWPASVPTAFGSPADDVALFGEKRNEIRVRARDVRAVLFHIEECGGVRALRPIGAHQHPGAGFDAAVLCVSQFSTCCGVSRKSGSLATSRETSMTQAGAKNFLRGCCRWRCWGSLFR